MCVLILRHNNNLYATKLSAKRGALHSKYLIFIGQSTKAIWYLFLKVMAAEHAFAPIFAPKKRKGFPLYRCRKQILSKKLHFL
jgi:hypothetical protein